MDLTSLTGQETELEIEGLCINALTPVSGKALPTAAVCVCPQWVPLAKQLLTGSEVRVATVGGFPSGENPIEVRIKEVAEALNNGADEIDVVISWRLANEDQWSDLEKEIASLRSAARGITLKAILATGNLRSPQTIRDASRLALEQGADFIKTSTGKETINATLDAGVLMCKELREFRQSSGAMRGIKPAGGIKTVQTALDWVSLVRTELGAEWLTPEHFRIGASSLLGEVRQLLAST